MTFGAAAIGAALTSDVFVGSRQDYEAKSCNECSSTGQRTNRSIEQVRNRCCSQSDPINHQSHPQPMILASSPKNSTPELPFNTLKQNPIECDYVIIGHGRAGKSALRTLKALDPSADITVIDPNFLHESNNVEQPNRQKGHGKLYHLQTRATSIDHSQKIVRISPIALPNSKTSSSTIHYRKSILLATGSRGAPPPEECIGPDSKARIVELRSTTVPRSVGKRTQQQMPVLDPAGVRSLSLMAASQGATVAVMGSGFEALELAASLAHACVKKANEDENKKVLMLFGNSGPLSSRLPRYLSAAVSKRLRQWGIDVEERSMTRYLSMENSTEIPRLELYTVKSYDRLDSRRLVADLLVLAPSVSGMNGTAVLPVVNDTTTKTASYNYQPWSSLITPSLLTCYLEDGRVATNSEFLAASSVYAAGSVAKYPNGRTGQADVAGGDHMSAELSGEVAARNMIKESWGAKKNGYVNKPISSHIQEAILVWRSDQIPYFPNKNVEQSSTLALYAMGIHALCVGNCDSALMATHGFWWTNTNNQSETKIVRDADSATSEIKSRPNAFMRRMTRRATNNSAKGSFYRCGSLPVYGSGVVFYLDQCGSIQGIMLWGLPFSQDSSNAQSNINCLLVERMKDVIRSNGGVVVRDHSDNIVNESYGVTLDLDLLSYLHLAEESKHLASMALRGTSSIDSSKPKIVLGRPLHRYTPWKPSDMTNLGKVRRKDEMGHVATTDDLFYSNMSSTSSLIPNQWTEEPVRPPSLKRIYTMQGEATWTLNVESDQLSEERSRPPKEEPLWLRQSEQWRLVNKKESLANEFIMNMRSGQFSDGSEAVRQAPMPKIYLDTKEKLRSWTSNGEKDETNVTED